MNFTTKDNKLSVDDPNDRTGFPVNVRRRTRADLIKEITRAGSILKDTECNAVITRYWQQIRAYIESGEEYADEDIATELSIAGIFIDEDDRFDPARHSVKVSFRENKSFKAAATKIKPTYVKPTEAGPQIERVIDGISKSKNGNITSGGVIEINGSMLKIEGDNPGSGLYFTLSDGTIEKAVTLVKNLPSMIIAIVPALPTGEEVTISIVSQYTHGGTLLKEPRKGIFNKSLTVI